LDGSVKPFTAATGIRRRRHTDLKVHSMLMIPGSDSCL
jgi:hypothetical protein